MKYIKTFEYNQPKSYGRYGVFYDKDFIDRDLIVPENVWYYAEILGKKIHEFLQNLYPNKNISIRRDRDDSRLVIFIASSNFIDFMDNTSFNMGMKGLQLMIMGPLSPKIVTDQYKIIPGLINAREYLVSIFKKFGKVQKEDDDLLMTFCKFTKTKQIINVINNISIDEYQMLQDTKKYNL